MSTDTRPPGTRERLLQAMGEALQRRGLHGVGLSELLTRAQAPKGVLYHHFPGGKTELAVAAIEAAVAQLLRSLDRLQIAGTPLLEGLRVWLGAAQKQLERSAFETGCPLATVALESGAADLALREALARGFAAIRERLGVVLMQAGVGAAQSAQLSALIVAAYEGALMQARVAGSAAPMTDTVQALDMLLRLALANPENTP